MNPQDEQQIELYVDRLCAQLIKLPKEKQDEVRDETRAHLAAIIAAQEATGTTTTEVVTAALKQFGDPVSIGHRIATECRRDAIHEKQAMWAVRLCALPLAAWVLWSLAFCFLRNFDDMTHPQDIQGLHAYRVSILALCIPTLLIAWRVYHLRFWACALLGVVAVLHTSYLLAQAYYMQQSFVGAPTGWTFSMAIHLIPMIVATSILPALIMPPVLLLRWRRLRLGV